MKYNLQLQYLELDRFKRELMMNQQVKIPFLNSRERVNYKSGYWNMLMQRFVPRMHIMSITTGILIIIMIAFILPRIIFSPPHYQSFLVLPSPQMDKWVLDVELIKSNKFYIYQVVTAIFLHESYLHFIGNIIFAVFIMYELEYCWKPSLLIGLCAGITAHFLAIIMGQGKYVGFSGALAGYFAIYLVTLIINCPQLSTRYERTQLFFVFWLAIIMSFMIISNGSGALMHLFGYLSGMLYGAGFYPSSQNSILSSFVQLVLKFVSVFVFVGLGLWAVVA